MSDSTLPSHRIPIVVVLSPSAALLAACEEAVRGLEEPPAVKVTDVASAATMVAEWRPFAIVVTEQVFAFDPQEFTSLAHAVGAEVILVGTDESPGGLASRLARRLHETFAWWQSKRAIAP